jgi:hypothetical protein
MSTSMMLLKMVSSSSAAAKTSKLAVVLLRRQQQQQLQRTTCVRSSSITSCSRVSIRMKSSPLTLRPLPVRFFSSAVIGTTTAEEEIKRLYSSSSSQSQSQSQLQSQTQTQSQKSILLPYFNKVLIANRGEIAIRIARTCRRLHIKTVAVYTYNDTKSIHINECDESYCIGDSYLNIDKIRTAIQVTKSDAVHPGKKFV